MLPFDPIVHHRRSIRLKGYDYSQAGAYFVTTVAWQRERSFGEVSNGEMLLNRNGHIVRKAWFDLPNHYPTVKLGEFVIMPNHVHAIIVLTDGGSRGGSAMLGQDALPDPEPAGREPLPIRETRPYAKQTRPYLSEIVRAFKSFSARRINRLRHAEGIPVWQRNYYEHIIRNQREMERIAGYIEANPVMWDKDDENPAGGRAA